MKIFIYDESRVLMRTVGTPDVMQGENNATLIFMSVAGIDETNFQNYLAQFAATIGTSHPADIITDFGTYVLDGIEYKGWKYLVSSKFTQVAGVLNANLVLSSNGSTLISQTVSLNVNPSASGVTWFKNITQAQWNALVGYCIGMRNPNMGTIAQSYLDYYYGETKVGSYVYFDDGGKAHLLFVGYDSDNGITTQNDYSYTATSLKVDVRERTNNVWSSWITIGIGNVPSSRLIAGLSLEANISENALFDKMSIKGRYATLSDLQTANPNTGYCYLVEADNHWYYWNGTSWADGGFYQATKLAENGVNITNVSNDFKLTKDRINGLSDIPFEIGTLTTSGGDFYASTSRVRTTQFLKLKVGDIVRSCDGYSFQLFRYNDIGQFQAKETTSYTNAKAITTEGFYLITARKDDNSDIADASIFKTKIYAVYENDPEIIYEDGLENSIDWSNGFITNTGAFSNIGVLYNQVATHDIVCFKEKHLVKTKRPEFLLKVSYYDYNSTFVSDTGWVREATIPANSITKLTIRSAQATTTKYHHSEVRDYSVEEIISQFFLDKAGEYTTHTPKQSGKRYMHVSFDDFDTPFIDITTNADTYTSIFQNEFFAWLKTLHERYGCVFSCYCYLLDGTYNILNVTDKFTDEFKANSDWLKFGFHTKDPNVNYANGTAEGATTDYAKFVTNIVRICGSVDSIDVMPRLHNFSGNKESLVAMRDCDCGLKGALGADDTRQNYYLSADDGGYLFSHERYFDPETQLHFLTTDIRIERDDSDSILASIGDGEATWANKCETLVIFTHTWAINSSIKAELEKCLAFAITNGYDFDYPQNREI